jgi:hypothetical protein
VAIAYHDGSSGSPRLVTVPPGSVELHVATLPAPVARVLSNPTAIAPDGSLWQALDCGNVLARADRRGALTRIRIAHAACRSAFDFASDTTFAFGGDGSVWFGALCRAELVRIPLVGSRRAWRLPRRPGCGGFGDELAQAHPQLVPLAGGGVRFAGGRIDARGHLRLDGVRLPDAVAPDGADWRMGAQTLVRRAPDGRERRFEATDDGRRYVASAIGPDGRLWYLRARLGDGLSLGNFNYDFVLGALTTDGHDVQQAVAPNEELRPQLVPSGAGAIWLGSGRSTLRIPLARSLPALTHVVVVGEVARRGASAWFELSCSSLRPGTICDGAVRLRSPRSGRSLVRATARFAVPAGEARAIPLTLRRGALHTLRRGGSLSAVASVRAHGGGARAMRLRLR